MRPSLLRFAFRVLGNTRNCNLSIVFARQYTLLLTCTSCLTVLSVSPLVIMNRNNSNKTGPSPSRGLKVQDKKKSKDVKLKAKPKESQSHSQSQSDDDSQEMGQSSSKNSKDNFKKQLQVEENKKRYSEMTLGEKRQNYKCGVNGYKELIDIPTWHDYSLDKLQHRKHSHDSAKDEPYQVNEELNKKMSLFVGDITTLEIDAIVNAANKSLMGGGGVDGAIHSAAGDDLKVECDLLNGCNTGEAKITCGYNLPAKNIIHTVGPIGEKKEKLRSAYQSCLDLVKENKLKSVAFPCISTGIYGYPVEKATPVALETIRKWLEKNKDEVERIILCVFLAKDVKVYENLMQRYFPLPPRTTEDSEAEEDDEEKSVKTSDVKKGTESRHQHSQENAQANSPKKRSPGSEASESETPAAVDSSSTSPQTDDRKGEMFDRNKSAAAFSNQESKRKKGEAESGDQEITAAAAVRVEMKTFEPSAAVNEEKSTEKPRDGQRNHAAKEKRNKHVDEVKKEKDD